MSKSTIAQEDQSAMAVKEAIEAGYFSHDGNGVILTEKARKDVRAWKEANKALSLAFMLRGIEVLDEAGDLADGAKERLFGQLQVC